MIESVRTPEERFENLTDFPFKPNYLEDINGYESLRMHYLNEGPINSEHNFLCLHGQPTWSYLYRKMIPVFLSRGHRVIAPDFFGFGRSDKPIDENIYTFFFHRNSILELIKALDLTNITLVCQDWGGIIGLTLPMEMPERFSSMIVMNTTLAVGDVSKAKGFLAWRKWSNSHLDFDIGRLMQRACPNLTNEEKAAYEAPFPDSKYRAGVRRFPNIVPDSPDAEGAEISRRADNWLSNKWSGKTFMAIGMMDPVLGTPIMRIVKKSIKNCPKPLYLREAGHFVQEWGDLVAKKALEAFNY